MLAGKQRPVRSDCVAHQFDGTANGSGGAQSLLWLHTNHLGTPIAASNASGTAQPLTGFTLPGFPGQLRTLADLYYNQHRDYDPTTGRYIQADPIGLAGDANPYLYAGGNPGRFTDAEGLQVVVPLPRVVPYPVPGTVPDPSDVNANGVDDNTEAIAARVSQGIRNVYHWVRSCFASSNQPDPDDERCLRRRADVENAISRLRHRAREFDEDVNEEALRDPEARMRHLQSRGQARNMLRNAVRRARYSGCAYNPEADRLLSLYSGYNP